MPCIKLTFQTASIERIFLHNYVEDVNWRPPVKKDNEMHSKKMKNKEPTGSCQPFLLFVVRPFVMVMSTMGYLSSNTWIYFQWVLQVVCIEQCCMWGESSCYRKSFDRSIVSTYCMKQKQLSKCQSLVSYLQNRLTTCSLQWTPRCNTSLSRVHISFKWYRKVGGLYFLYGKHIAVSKI